MNTKAIPVYVMPKLKQYLETNGPWSQLVTLKNIKLELLDDTSVVQARGTEQTIASGFAVSAFIVPHRDEYSETAGFRIQLGGRKYLFIPDVDKWTKWETDIRKAVASVDIALLDGTFFSDGELPGRNMSEVPHPFVQETISLFTDRDLRKHLHFIHFNHTNPLLWDDKAVREVEKQGFHIARQGDKL